MTNVMYYSSEAMDMRPQQSMLGTNKTAFVIS